MIATFINMVLVLIGGTIGLVFKNRISEKISQSLVCVLGLCVLVIGIQSAVKTENMILVIISIIIGTLLGEWLNIEGHLYSLGESLKNKFGKGESSKTFAEGFLSSSLLFCVGSMAVMGSMEAGINSDYSIIISKSIIDGITAISLAATLGVGVLFSAFAILIYQGSITIISMYLGSFMSPVMITEMSAVGGILIIALALNMLEIRKTKPGNMLPAILVPVIYYPLANWILTSI